jgi:hypothetical protein
MRPPEQILTLLKPKAALMMVSDNTAGAVSQPDIAAVIVYHHYCLVPRPRAQLLMYYYLVQPSPASFVFIAGGAGRVC